MTIKYQFDWTEPIAQARCLASELTDNGDGTYSIKDSAISDNPAFGTGSEIIAVDLPGKLLYWDSESALAYDWNYTAGE